MNIGDSVFLKNRVSGVVIDKYPDGRLSIEQEGPTYDRTRKIGFINGLSVSEREEFFRVMNEIKNIKDPMTRYESLADKIEGIKQKNLELELGRSLMETEQEYNDSLKQEQANSKIIKYLQAELNHIGSSNNIVPRIYTADPRSL